MKLLEMKKGWGLVVIHESHFLLSRLAISASSMAEMMGCRLLSMGASCHNPL